MENKEEERVGRGFKGIMSGRRTKEEEDEWRRKEEEDDERQGR